MMTFKRTLPPLGCGFGRRIVAMVVAMALSVDAAETPTVASRDGEESAATEAAPAESLALMVVRAPPYQLRLTLLQALTWEMVGRLNASLGWPVGGPFIITPGRLPQQPRNVVFSASVIEGNAIREAPVATMAGTLRSLPWYELSSRDRGVSAAGEQGAVLRGVGGSGAGVRALLDGVPVSDPFRGGVSWVEVPREGLLRAEVVPGGGAVGWGEGTTGGLVQFFTIPATGRVVTEPAPTDGDPDYPVLPLRTIRGWGRASLMAGGLGTRSAEFVMDQPTTRGVVQILGRAFSSDGYAPVAPEDRGLIDRAAGGRHHWITARWRQPLGKRSELTATLRSFEASHGDGTPYRQSRSSGAFASVALAGAEPAGFAWNAVLYAQDRSRAQSFSSIASDRATETPVFDQFATPTVAAGASWTGAWWHVADARTNIGADVRMVRGEARSRLAFSEGEFARERVAGGEQEIAGVFVLHNRRLSDSWRGTLGARVDAWRETGGRVRETDRRTRVIFRDERHPVERGAEVSGSMGAVWSSDKNWRLRIAGQNAFRRPTLGERFETTARDAVLTEANPRLRTEYGVNLEAGAEWSPAAAVSFDATAFVNELRDAIGSVALPRGSGAFPTPDGLPVGYDERVRVNFDRAQVRGAGLSAKWTPSAALSLEAGALFSDASIRRVTMARTLEGNRMAEISRRAATVSVRWQPAKTIALRMRVRVLGRQFADNENTQRLGTAVVADVGVNYVFNERIEIFVLGENVADARSETGRGMDGVVFTGSPRVLLAGLRFTW